MGIGVFGCIKKTKYITATSLRFAMLKIILLIPTVSLAFADLQGEAKFGDTTLKYYDDHMDDATFGTAVVSCVQKGGELVMPKNTYLNAAVEDLTQGQAAWIGGGDMFGEDNYEWNDGERFEWSNWLPGEPNNHGGDENCIEINHESRGTWNDLWCCHSRGYVCQIPDAVSAPYEKSEFTVYDDSSDRRSFSEAKQFCESRRSRLPLLRGDDDATFLLSKLIDDGMKQFWITDDQDESSCKSMSYNGISSDDCQQSISFLCEEVSPYDLSVSKQQATVESGTNLNVDCSASGVPVPQVAWYRDGVHVPNQKKGIGSSTLVVDGVSSSDIGMYVCEAVNEVGGKQRSMKGYSFIETASILE